MQTLPAQQHETATERCQSAAQHGMIIHSLLPDRSAVHAGSVHHVQLMKQGYVSSADHHLLALKFYKICNHASTRLPVASSMNDLSTCAYNTEKIRLVVPSSSCLQE